MSHLVIQWCTIFLFSVLYKIPVFSVVQNSCFQWCTIFLYEMLYLSLFCLNLLYKSLDVYNSGGGVVPNSDVYKYSDPYLEVIITRRLPSLFDTQSTNILRQCQPSSRSPPRITHMIPTRTPYFEEPRGYSTQRTWSRRSILRIVHFRLLQFPLCDFCYTHWF